jgi:hypothetical protein
MLMELIIRYYKDGQATEERWNSYKLAEAEEIVRNWIEDGSADLVEIRNDRGELVFHHHSGKHHAS